MRPLFVKTWARLAPVLRDIAYVIAGVAIAGTVGDEIPGQAYDHPIVRTLWMSLDELRECPQRHRSPMLLACLEDHAAGRGFGLDLLHMHESVKLLHK